MSKMTMRMSIYSQCARAFTKTSLDTCQNFDIFDFLQNKKKNCRKETKNKHFYAI